MRTRALPILASIVPVGVLAGALAGAGCGGNGANAPHDAAQADLVIVDHDAAPSDAAHDGGGDTAVAHDGGGDGGANPCPRQAAAADRVRRVVVSHPYGAGGANATAYEVLDLSTTGTLTRPGVTFSMGRSLDGEIGFTPDGQVGIVVQEDGSLGVFTLDSSGAPTVVQASFTGGFYAGRVIMDPAGDGAFVLDDEWRTNGGGIYRVSIGCDGKLRDEGLVAAAKLPGALVLLPDGRAVVAAYDLLGSTAGTDANDTFLLSSLAPATLAASASAFPVSDGGVDEQIVSAAAVTSDNRYVLIGDNSEFRDYGGTRIAAVEVLAQSLRPAQVFDFNDPVALVTSPFGHPVIGVSGYGDAIYVIDYDDQSATPFSVRGELPHSGTGPQLPAAAVMIRTGSLKGLVLISELEGVRQVAFHDDFSVVDLGVFSFGSDYTAMAGAIGVQP